MIKLFKNPLFFFGLLLRFLIIITVMPQAASQWYVPFLDVTTQHFTLNPWKVFLLAGYSDVAFPYGYAMWFIFLPLTKLCHLFGVASYFGYSLTLLAADISILFILKATFQTTDRLLLIAYWLSPLVLFATYWLGFNDLIPVALLYFALYFMRQLKLSYTGVFCSLAVSAKFSMLLAIPFFGIYLFRNRSLRPLLLFYLIGFTVTMVLCGLPFLLSQEGVYMLIHNPEMGKVCQLTLQIGSTTFIYLLPMIYLFMLYLAWHMRRINFELLNTLFGLSFFFVVLLTPASPGWFIWMTPLLVLYQARKGNIAIFLVAGFTVLCMIRSFLIIPPPSILGSDAAIQMALILNHWLEPFGISFLHTILMTFGVILILRIWREMVQGNDYFRLSRKPFAIGIAGDSGAGKDTLVYSLQGLFGSHSVVVLSGDDYHLWDRQKPIWRVMTHLNPQANNLEQFAQDLMTLADGKNIYIRHYNHENGKMTVPQLVKRNDFIIASGLHTLYLPILRDCYDLKIYLDMDEGMRRYFKLQRDTHLRGYSYEKVLLSLDTRKNDAEKFIFPQIAHADLILSLQPIHPCILQNMNNRNSLYLKLLVRSRREFNEESLLRVLIGICGLHVDMKTNRDTNEISLAIEGEATAGDIALAAKKLLPRISEFLDIAPRWEDGIKGLMQLIVLSHINQSLRERLI